MAMIIFKSILFIAGLGNIDGTLASPNGIIIFKSILSTAGLGNIDGTLERPNCVKHPGWSFTMTISFQNVNLKLFC